MAPEKVVRDSCVICLTPAHGIDEWLIDVKQPEKGRTSQNKQEEPAVDASHPLIVHSGLPQASEREIVHSRLLLAPDQVFSETGACNQ